MVTNEQIQQLFQKVKKNVNLEEKIINKFNVKQKVIKLKDETLGSQIAYYRQMKNMTQEDLANKTNLSRNVIINYENNKESKQINKRTLNNYKNIFKVLNIENKIKLYGYEKFIITGQAENLRKAIKKSGLQQKQLAKIINEPYQTFQQWVQGRININKKVYNKLNKIFMEMGYKLVD